MVSTTIRIPCEVREQIRQLAEEQHASMQAIIARAVEEYRWEQMMKHANEIYAAMTPKDWAEEKAERALWDCTLMDGLEDDEYEF